MTRKSRRGVPEKGCAAHGQSALAIPIRRTGIATVRVAARRPVNVPQLRDLLVEEPVDHAAEYQEPQDAFDPRDVGAKEPTVLIGPTPAAQSHEQLRRTCGHPSQQKAGRHEDLLHVRRFGAPAWNLPVLDIVRPLLLDIVYRPHPVCPSQARPYARSYRVRRPYARS